MRFSNGYALLCCFFLIVLFVNSQAYGQDSLAVPDRTSDALDENSKVKEYKTVAYLSGFLASSRNDAFFDKLYAQGIGLQLGVPLYSHQYYTLRFNVFYSKYKFRMEEYLKTDSLKEGESASGRDMEVVTFAPDLMVHPFPKWLASPCLLAGVGYMVGSNEPSVIVSKPDGKESIYNLPFGTRFTAYTGLGVVVGVIPALNIVAGASYHFEFLPNNQPEDIFYTFKKADTRYKFLVYSLGIQLKLKQ